MRAGGQRKIVTHFRLVRMNVNTSDKDGAGDTASLIRFTEASRLSQCSYRAHHSRGANKPRDSSGV